MKKIFFLTCTMMMVLFTFGQIPQTAADYSYKGSINLGTGSGTYSATAPSTWLQMGPSGTTKAVIMPRVNDTSSVVTPTEGMVVYSLTTHKQYVRTIGRWEEMVTIYYPTGGGGSGNADSLGHIAAADYALLADLTGYVPYTAASSDLDMNGHNITANTFNAPKITLGDYLFNIIMDNTTGDAFTAIDFRENGVGYATLLVNSGSAAFSSHGSVPFEFRNDAGDAAQTANIRTEPTNGFVTVGYSDITAIVPTHRLEVYGTGYYESDGNNQLTINNSQASGPTSLAELIFLDNGAPSGNMSSRIGAAAFNTYNYGDDFYLIIANGGFGFPSIMASGTTGYVSIGAPSYVPLNTHMFEVYGDIYSSGGLVATLPATTTAEAVFYDHTTGELTYGPTASGGATSFSTVGGDVNGMATGSTFTPTLTLNSSQPNIKILGTLDSLNISGNIHLPGTSSQYLDGTGALRTSTSGTVAKYTPTYTLGTNMNGIASVQQLNYSVNGNSVHIWGVVPQITVTAANSVSIFNINTPVNSRFSADAFANREGTGLCHTANVTGYGVVYNSTSDNKLSFQFTLSTTSSTALYFECTYTIIP